MKKKILVVGLTLGVSLAAVGATFGLVLANAKRAVPTEAVSPYTIGAADFEVATMEQFNNGSDKYSYSIDKPLGNHSLAGHMYGSYDDGVKEKKEYDLKIGVIDTTEETPLKWKFSGVRAKSDLTTRLTTVQIENSSGSRNICKPEYFSEADYPDEYAIGQLMLTQSNVDRAGAMISKTAIADIQDISFYWRKSYAQKLYVCYQLDGETEWKIHYYTYVEDIDGDPLPGNYSGTRGWDSYGYTTFNDSEWGNSELKGKTAKIAIVIAGKISANLPISAIAINTNKAAVRYLNVLTYREGICTDGNGSDLNKGTADYSHNQALFQLATEHATGEYLAGFDLAGNKTATPNVNALGFYNHLVTAISALGETK